MDKNLSRKFYINDLSNNLINDFKIKKDLNQSKNYLIILVKNIRKNF